ncbi:MAG: peptidyl-prolyl cis-trans isomerase [Verrucomicrobiales bacterium]|nr:peptidyl-prolyl cis-trans isomerase [Verrucomicrobiales bacterium]
MAILVVSIPLLKARSIFFPSLFIAVGIALIGCGGEKPAAQLSVSPEVVAKVGELTIAAEDLSEALAKRAKSLGGEAGPTLRQQVLDELIREKVLLNKARAAAVDRDPELVRRWERMVVAKYETAHKPDVEKQPAPTTAEVEEFYRENAAEYQRPERIRVALIQVKGSAKATVEKRAELRARAEKVRRLAQEPNANFSEVTRLHSEDRATRYSGGEVGWLERGQTPPSWPKELVDAAFSLETAGVIAPLVEAGGGFYVLKLIERQAGGLRPLAEVREQLVHQLKERQRLANAERFYAEQRVGVTVEINQSALQAVPLPASVVAKAPTAPPSLPSN